MSRTSDIPLLPCPNPECGSAEIVMDQHPQILTSKAVRCLCLGCQTCGPLRNDEASARRLWNLLPRALEWMSEVTKPGRYLLCCADRETWSFYDVTQGELDRRRGKSFGCFKCLLFGPIPEAVLPKEAVVERT